MFATLPSPVAAFCDPPIAPAPTSLELAKEYREEFKLEFETYFSDAQTYFSCSEAERAEIMREVGQTVKRYERLLRDSENWVQE